MKKNLFPLLRRLPNTIRRIAFFILLFFCCSNITTGQNLLKGILWVIPSDPSALPINNTITGNPELNKLFKDFHVKNYYFLDSLALAFLEQIKPVYEIRLKEEYADLEVDLINELHYCYKNLFSCVGRAYSIEHSYYYNTIILPYFINSSVEPCSPTRSCNKELNAILDRHNILAYSLECLVIGEDTLVKWIQIFCVYPDVLTLYYDLLPFKHLLGEVYISGGCDFYPDITYPCNTYGINPETKLLIAVSPNPVRDIATISGLSPQELTLYDYQGKVVLTQANPSNIIDMSRFPQGLYFLHIISDTGTVHVQKLIKQ